MNLKLHILFQDNILQPNNKEVNNISQKMKGNRGERRKGTIASQLETKLLKSALRRCKHCVLAVVRRSKFFSLHHRPASQGRGMAKI